MNSPYLHADERGSIIAVSNASGQVTQINAYDDYGIPKGKNAAGGITAGGTATALFGRFSYTGQTWLPEAGVYYYKNRIYSPMIGRFPQPDPIGYADGVNLYGYVGRDPVNKRDPLGLTCLGLPNGSGLGGSPTPSQGQSSCEGGTIVVTAQIGGPSLSGGFSITSLIPNIDFSALNALLNFDPSARLADNSEPDIVVTAQKKCNIFCRVGRLLNGTGKTAKQALCASPTFTGGVGFDGYTVFGGSVGVGVSFDPRTGQVGVTGSLGVGVGAIANGGVNIGGRPSENPVFFGKFDRLGWRRFACWPYSIYSRWFGQF